MTISPGSLDRRDDPGRTTIARRIAEQLRDAIVTMRLKPGDTISESEIASRFGVSRQPVREAFIQLAEQELLRIRPQRPTEVVRISIRGVLNARFVREALEVAVARKAWLTPRHVLNTRDLKEVEEFLAERVQARAP